MKMIMLTGVHAFEFNPITGKSNEIILIMYKIKVSRINGI